MGELISRQAVIKALEMHCYPIRYDHNSIEKGMTITGIKQVLDELPPAQPVQCEDAVSRKAVQYLLAHFVDEDKYVDACDGLKHLPSVTPKQKWIPVTKRLPEKEGEYLVTNDSGGVKNVEVDTLMRYEDGGLFWLYSQNAIAWMPLPKPWEGEKE